MAPSDCVADKGLNKEKSECVRRDVQESQRRREFPAFARRGGCADQVLIDCGADGAVENSNKFLGGT